MRIRGGRSDAVGTWRRATLDRMAGRAAAVAAPGRSATVDWHGESKFWV
jgi:hypothetical protein